jgi:hypothetical protein
MSGMMQYTLCVAFVTLLMQYTLCVAFVTLLTMYEAVKGSKF